ncbi:helix-turn-helix domain-containing protein [Blastochloris tepida]|uniref:Uncharacterized protein n=1 Tax=Blastochloris tepida TaxID=2233851 RepID=A0A348FZD3_9HYPH|nr:helix-turn-helix domain-containing protein [Blastochloris tepida]BBF92666.1 hypothetical protein BLTE_13510 [Blastochloris tepida]
MLAGKMNPSRPKTDWTPRIVSDYRALVQCLRDRKDDLGISLLELDERSGLQVGYSGKLLGAGMVRTLGPLSMGLMLGALGLELMVVERGSAVVNPARDRALALHREGLSARAISKALRVNRSTVQLWLRGGRHWRKDTK